mgnify:CR=1 FL=1
MNEKYDCPPRCEKCQRCHRGECNSQPSEEVGCCVLLAAGEYKVIGWIAHGMDVYKKDKYKGIYGHPDTRKPPKIYRTKEIAKRYGDPIAVYILA